MKDNEQSYYEYIKANDLIGMLKVLLDRGGYRLRESDGKFVSEQVMSTDTPWHHVNQAEGLDCQLWHQILFDVISQQLPKGQQFVPSKCQSCWKVVVRPKTVFQLLHLEKLQKELGLFCKCGIEVRPSVHGLYGGYFYNKSLEEGQECYRIVRKAIDEYPELGPDIPVLLKRACTEYELACGPSDKWEVTEFQLAIEDLVDELIERPKVMLNAQPEHLIRHIHGKWIEWAYAHGDETYKHFTNGKPLYPEYVTYHQDI